MSKAKRKVAQAWDAKATLGSKTIIVPVHYNTTDLEIEKMVITFFDLKKIIRTLRRVMRLNQKTHIRFDHAKVEFSCLEDEFVIDGCFVSYYPDGFIEVRSWLKHSEDCNIDSDQISLQRLINLSKEEGGL